MLRSLDLPARVHSAIYYEKVSYIKEKIKAMEAEIEVFEGPNDEGEMFTLGSKLSDHFSLPCANEAAVRIGHTLKEFSFNPTLQSTSNPSSSGGTPQMEAKFEDMWTLESLQHTQASRTATNRSDPPSSSHMRLRNPSLAPRGENSKGVYDMPANKTPSSPLKDGQTRAIKTQRKKPPNQGAPPENSIMSHPVYSKFNVLNKNIPDAKNFKAETVADKTTKVMSINSQDVPNLPTHLIRDHKPNALGTTTSLSGQDITIEVTSLKSSSTNQQTISRNGKSIPSLKTVSYQTLTSS
ncbi:Cytochrome c1-1, heme protein, mitochondrial [Capsicum baccatum]|uniref:Cytochrome c1-1, heme protein, mitochondrial n=1 Tax=Capsicum baccatum TaxID=33114 RepID=A0A2G2WTK1_CAPBA|nr:Cytochrome c1-1, heme protein, mitochondrial [Capsicum baccatum]